MAATAGIFAQCSTVACAVPVWVTARSCLLRTIFYPSLTCHNLGYQGTGLAVESLFQFQKRPWSKVPVFQVANSWGLRLSFSVCLYSVCSARAHEAQCQWSPSYGLWDSRSPRHGWSAHPCCLCKSFTRGRNEWGAVGAVRPFCRPESLRNFSPKPVK